MDSGFAMLRIVDLLRDDRTRGRIIDECVDRSKALDSSRQLDPEVIKGDLPEYLDELAAALDLTRDPDSMTSVAKHVGNRFAHGFGVRDLIAEYQIVRSVVLRVFVDEEHERQPSLSELARLNETIDDSIRRAVDAFIGERDRARDIFVAILAHDLRGPLQSIASTAELMMLRPCDDATVSRSGCRIVSTVRRMSDLIATLLDFARIQLAGGIPVQRTRLDVRTVLQDVLEEVVVANPTRRIESRVTQAHGNFCGYFDGTRVAQAVTNLVRNAIEHGGDPITLELFDEGDTVCIEVCNEGSIPIDLLPRLFLPFARTRNGGGLGLGLFITSEIARAHGGRVVVAERDHRVRFSMYLRRVDGSTRTDPRS